MNIVIKDTAEEAVRADVLVLPCFENPPSDIYADINAIIGGLIAKVINTKEFTGKHNQLTLLHAHGINASRILMIGLGKQAELTPERLRQAGGKAFSYARDLGCSDIAVSTMQFRTTLQEFAIATGAKNKQVVYFVEGGLLSLYRFEKYKKKENGKGLATLIVLDDDKGLPLKKIETVVSAVMFARDLVNTPSNDMTPTALSVAAQSLAENKKIKVKILEERDTKKEGMGAYLAVARGSAEPPKFIVLEYKGGKGAPLVLIGKAITFDSGGISIKPAEGMEKMKYDMAGGSAVLGVIKAAAALGLPVNLVGIVPATENLPSGTAFKPGDVLRAVNGLTIEIISTDAEGRLILADAIGYALKYYSPKAVIDIATLTGACSIALGNEAIAMMGNDQDLMEQVKRASEETYERVWQMPLYDEYKDYLKSDVADMKNAGGRKGSLVTAAYFLKEFAGTTPWIHLDIAGTAWNEKDKPYIPKGATGIGVRLLVTFLEGLCPAGK
ncbi:MAG: leucyl aminopeptidase [Nitrospirota bacterium]